MQPVRLFLLALLPLSALAGDTLTPPATPKPAETKKESQAKAPAAVMPPPMLRAEDLPRDVEGLNIFGRGLLATPAFNIPTAC